MARVFISYRRADSQGEAGRLHDALQSMLGAGAVFRDVADIPGGADFEVKLRGALAGCDTVLVLMGERWLGELQERLPRVEPDYVRIEVAEALRGGRRVVPVLLRGNRMPLPSEVPPDLQPLCKRNAMSLRDDIWDADVRKIADSLGRPYSWRALLLRAMAALVIVPIATFLLLGSLPADSARYAVLGGLAAYLAAEGAAWAWHQRRIRRLHAEATQVAAGC